MISTDTRPCAPNCYTPDVPTGTPRPPLPECAEGFTLTPDGGGGGYCAEVAIAEPLPPTGFAFSPDLAIGAALLIVLGVALLRARIADRRLYGKGSR